MDRYLYNALNKYFKTLSYTGTINKGDKYSLFAISSIYNIYKLFSRLITKEDSERINAYIRCLVKNNCLFEGDVPCLSYNVEIDDSLITIKDGEVMTTIHGITIVSTQRVTQKFTDFSVREEVESDQYLVGYDQSDNTEVAINVKDIGIFWEE